jgi:hypothetical protein
VFIDYRQSGAEARLALAQTWRVIPDDATMLRLGERFGMDNVSLYYG